MRRSIQIGLVLSGVLLLFLKLFLDLYNGASNSLGPNIANDVITLIGPFYDYARDSVHSGSVPLWNPYASLGTPFAADIVLGMLYPINWIIFLLDVPIALTVIQFITVMIGMTGMYFYAQYIRLVWPARILTVVLFAFAVFTEAFHPALGSSFCWFPALLWLTHRFFDAPSQLNAFYIVAALALCFLAGFPNFFWYTCMILGVYFLCVMCGSLADYGVRGLARRLGILLPAILLMLGLVAVQLLPTYELSMLSVRSVESGSAYKANSFWETFSLGLMFRNFFLTDLAYLYANSTIAIHSGLYYLGGALLLVLPFPFLQKRYRTVSIALGISLVFFSLFMISNQVPELSFLQKIPMADSLRVNGRGAAYVQFILIVMAGIGLSALHQHAVHAANASAGKLSVWPFGIFIAYAGFLAVFAVSIPDNNAFFVSFIPSVLVVLALQRGIGSKYASHMTWLIALFIVCDAGIHRENRFLVPAFMAQESATLAKNIRQAKDRNDRYRVLFEPDSLAQAYVLANIGSKYQIPSISSYTSLTLGRWESYLRYMTGPEAFDSMISRSVLQRFYGDFTPGLVSLLARSPGVLSPTSLRYRVTRGGNLETVDALPRAYAVSHYIQTADEGESLSAIRSNLATLAQTVVLENASPSFVPAALPTQYKEVVIRHLTSNRVELEVEVPEPSIVVLADSYYPGWEAEVSGEKTTVFRANSLFRAVEVPTGKHIIVFRFVPRSFYWGLFVSMLSLALITTLIFRERRHGHT